jgi:predicted ribonuclease YlaK
LAKQSYNTKRTTPVTIIPETVSYTLKKIAPLTENQRVFFDEWNNGQNLLLCGCSGTGKSLISLYSALRTVFDHRQPQTHILIVRSTQQTREQGHVKGTIAEKEAPFENIYKNIVADLIEVDSKFNNHEAYDKMKDTGVIKFVSTSFIRGETYNDCVIIVDEWENMWGRELASVLTRVGKNSRIIFCGDLAQTDLTKVAERDGFMNFIKVVRNMKSFTTVDFQIDDVVRSALCKEFLQTQYDLGISFL